jgi:hypothetical protein
MLTGFLQFDQGQVTVLAFLNQLVEEAMLNRARLGAKIAS